MRAVVSEMPNRFEKIFQISLDDLETCENALRAIREWISIAEPDTKEHFNMMCDAIKRVRDDYGPHQIVKVIDP